MKQRFSFLFILFMILPGLTMAQDSVSGNASGWIEQNMVLLVSLLVLLVAILTLIVLIYVLGIIRQLLLRPEGSEEEVPSMWTELTQKLTALKPIEQEEDLLLDHNYDGIRELDNHLPPWWKYLFYLTIVFAGVYVAVYHVFDAAPLQIEEYEISMAEAAAQIELTPGTGDTIDENNVVLLTDEARLQNGQSIFEQYCSSCHKVDGGGSIGPNLTDQYWVNGGSEKDIFRTIKYGVPEKGMVSWERQLTGSDIQDVTSYIVSLEGTNPPGAKEPQGELYDRNTEQ